ncbi:hypothetical protein [Agromyces aerolatus]|uniref:hypothetical protein n=1 Tax=Agromyces sp. LY-1074 TaxID=3074080 RepID=UPI0028637842|nr:MULTISPECIES: hypothetical protein [unclassified Agromyces]MDR5699614.1 hypothetical protein [Agromyces sp. LY-1074]MDR5705910.1 hypothetical protein [Agromyces sp. LY-1358]
MLADQKTSPHPGMSAVSIAIAPPINVAPTTSLRRTETLRKVASSRSTVDSGFGAAVLMSR